MVVLLGQDTMTGARRRENPELPGWTLVYREYQSSALSQICKYVGKQSVLPLENPLCRGSQSALACRDTWTCLAKVAKISFTKPQCKISPLGPVTVHCGSCGAIPHPLIPPFLPSSPCSLTCVCMDTLVAHSWYKVLSEFCNPAVWIPPFLTLCDCLESRKLQYHVQVAQQ